MFEVIYFNLNFLSSIFDTILRLGPNTALNCEWGNWGPWHSSNGNENEDRCACDKSKIERLEIEFPLVFFQIFQ